ncbi:MAG: phytanoyl-CoA dioxygenase family protein [Caldilineaceae bacterium]
MSETLLDQLKTVGWCVVENVIPAEQIAAIRASVAATVAKHRNPNAPKNIGHLSGLINYDQSFAPYLAHPPLLTLLEGVLGPGVRISFTTATINEPGNARGEWHADWPFNQRNAGHLPAPYPDLCMHLTTIWMLSDFSVETGGTLLIPSTHRLSHNPTGDHEVDSYQSFPEELNAVGAAGSVLVMDSRLWHATAPNTSPSPRVAIVIRYAPWWLDLGVLRPGSRARARLQSLTGQSENQVPPVPLAVFEELPETVQPLYAHWVEG